MSAICHYAANVTLKRLHDRANVWRVASEIIEAGHALPQPGGSARLWGKELGSCKSRDGSKLSKCIVSVTLAPQVHGSIPLAPTCEHGEMSGRKLLESHCRLSGVSCQMTLMHIGQSLIWS
jgi:hypothetical protein